MVHVFGYLILVAFLLMFTITGLAALVSLVTIAWPLLLVFVLYRWWSRWTSRCKCGTM
jgi:hypothetical protein